MRRLIAILLVVVVAFLSFAAVQAATRGTPAEAHSMLAMAVEHFKSAGRERALGDFTAGTAPFRDRDLYVVCVSADHKVAANGAFPASVGTSADVLVDAQGEALGKALWDAAARNTEGSIRYPMINPATRKLEDKTTFYAKVADDLLCGVGAYGAP